LPTVRRPKNQLLQPDRRAAIITETSNVAYNPSLVTTEGRPEAVAQDASCAIITPSYRGDFERCKILCKSIDAFVVGEWHHFIIVEKADLGIFKVLGGQNRTIIEMESLLPTWLHHLTSLSFLNNRSIWFSFRTGFMIGWHVQQLVKLEMAFRVKQQGLLYCDSDVFFVRPFNLGTLKVDGKFKFYRSYHQFNREEAPNPAYVIKAFQQLGMGTDPFPCPSYVDNMVPWHSPTVRALCEHIQQTSGKNWKVALGRNVIISEYSLYGLFVDRIMKDNSHLAPSWQSICKTEWRGGSMKAEELDEFCDNLLPGQVAVGFQSFLGIEESRLAAQLERAVDREQKQG
jgi:hypothetical protein